MKHITVVAQSIQNQIHLNPREYAFNLKTWWLWILF